MIEAAVRPTEFVTAAANDMKPLPLVARAPVSTDYKECLACQ